MNVGFTCRFARTFLARYNGVHKTLAIYVMETHRKHVSKADIVFIGYYIRTRGLRKRCPQTFGHAEHRDQGDE